MAFGALDALRLLRGALAKPDPDVARRRSRRDGHGRGLAPARRPLPEPKLRRQPSSWRPVETVHKDSAQALASFSKKAYGTPSDGGGV